MNRSPGLPAALLGQRRVAAASSSSASKLTAPTLAMTLARGGQAGERGRGVPALGHEQSGSTRRSSTNRKSTSGPIADKHGQALADHGQQRRGHPRPSGCARPRRSTRARAGRRPGTGSARSTRSSSDSLRIHWPFSHSSRSRSNTAPPWWTRSSSKRSTRSSSEKISSSVPLDQPSSARKLTNASGMKPWRGSRRPRSATCACSSWSGRD